MGVDYWSTKVVKNSASRAHIRVAAHFIPQAGIRAMAGDHRGVLIQAIQTLLDRALDGWVIAAPQVGAANTATKQGIAGNQQLSLREPKTHRTRRMPRGVQRHATTAI